MVSGALPSFAGLGPLLIKSVVTGFVSTLWQLVAFSVNWHAPGVALFHSMAHGVGLAHRELAVYALDPVAATILLHVAVTGFGLTLKRYARFVGAPLLHAGGRFVQRRTRRPER